MTLHPQVHIQHLMTRAEMKNMVNKKQAKVMVPSEGNDAYVDSVRIYGGPYGGEVSST